MRVSGYWASYVGGVRAEVLFFFFFLNYEPVYIFLHHARWILSVETQHPEINEDWSALRRWTAVIFRNENLVPVTWIHSSYIGSYCWLRIKKKKVLKMSRDDGVFSSVVEKLLVEHNDNTDTWRFLNAARVTWEVSVDIFYFIMIWCQQSWRNLSGSVSHTVGRTQLFWSKLQSTTGRRRQWRTDCGVGIIVKQYFCWWCSEYRTK